MGADTQRGAPKRGGGPNSCSEGRTKELSSRLGREETGLPLAFSGLSCVASDEALPFSGPQLHHQGAGRGYFRRPVNSSQSMVFGLGEPWFKFITSFGRANTYLCTQPWWLLWGARELCCKRRRVRGAVLSTLALPFVSADNQVTPLSATRRHEK